MRKDALRQNVESDEFNRQFTSDGKIDFKARVGLTKDQDPFKQFNYPADSAEQVAFDEHRSFQETSFDHQARNFGDDDDAGFSERW